MNEVIRLVAGRALRKAARSRIVQNLIGPADSHAGDKNHFPPMGEFVAANGQRFTLLANHRDRTAPGWEEMLRPVRDASRDTLLEKVKEARTAVSNIEMFLQLHGFSFVDRLVLEVGCHWGIHAYSVAELGARRVHGIDIPEYGVRQKPDTPLNSETIESQSEWLRNTRQAMSGFYSASHVSLVSFEDQDIAELKETGVYDAVVSWETMEHVKAPDRAFRKIYEALKPGGFSFHEYNPFFCEQGGHSLCTLDFPYGHCRLSPSDFKRYIKSLRPQEEKAAVSFYEDNLNRMTLADTESYARSAGFDIVSFIPWLAKGRLTAINRNILLQTRALYPTVQDKDLLASSVWLLVRKPEK